MAGSETTRSKIPPAISNPGDDASERILGSVLTVTILSLLTICTRIYCRFFMIRNMGWDDAMMVFAMTVSLSGSGLVVAQIPFGAGRHRGDLDIDDYNLGVKLNFISQPIYIIALALAKLSVGFSLLRIASTGMYRNIIIGVMCFTAVYSTCGFFAIILQCRDIRVMWNPSIKTTCWDGNTLRICSYTSATLNIITDLLFAIIIPAPMLWKLNVRRRTRISLIGVLALSGVACAGAFVKISFLSSYGELGDILWDIHDVTIWTATELNIGITAGSLPAVRPLFKRFLGSVYAKDSRRTPNPPTIYGQAGGKSGSRWRTLSSGRYPKNDDDMGLGGSQEAITTDADNGIEEFELTSQPRLKTTVVTGHPNQSSDSIEQLGISNRQAGREIKKTMTTTVNYSSPA